MNIAVYKNIAIEMNKEYSRLQSILNNQKEALVNINTIDFNKKSDRDNELKNKQEEIVQIALDLTNTSLNNHADYTISQIGNYQFWRNSESVAIIDSESNKLVAYGKDNDFFPEIIPINEINLQLTESLINKVYEANPKLILEYDPQILSNVYNHIKKINISPPQSYKSQEQNSLLVNTYTTVRDYLKNISVKLNINNLINFRQTIKLQADIIRTRIISQRLLIQAKNKFDYGYKKTNEQEYYVDRYIVRKIENNAFEIYDPNRKLLLVGFPGKENVVLQGNLGSYNELSKALKSFSNNSMSVIGNKRVEKQYQISVFSLMRKLANYENGNYQFKLNKDNIYMRKSKNVIELNNNQGANLLSVSPKSKQVNLSISEVFNLNKAIEEDLNNKKQDLIISNVSFTVKSYLDINQVNKIEKNNFVLSYNPKSQIIEYRDKLDLNNNFKSQKTLNGWKRVEGQITSEKHKYFAQLKIKIDSFQNSKIHDKSQKLY